MFCFYILYGAIKREQGFEGPSKHNLCRIGELWTGKGGKEEGDEQAGEKRVDMIIT